MEVCSSPYMRHLHLNILGMFQHGILFQFFDSVWFTDLQPGFVQLQQSTRNGALFTPFPGSTKCDAWDGIQATMDHFVEMYDVGFQRQQLSVGFLFLFAAIWFIMKCAERKDGKFQLLLLAKWMLIALNKTLFSLIRMKTLFIEVVLFAELHLEYLCTLSRCVFLHLDCNKMHYNGKI